MAIIRELNIVNRQVELIATLRVDLARANQLCEQLLEDVYKLTHSPDDKREYARRLAIALAALEELVACKDLKESAEKYVHTPECLAGSWQECPQTLMEKEYERRKPLAWAAARAAVGEIK